MKPEQLPMDSAEDADHGPVDVTTLMVPRRRRRREHHALDISIDVWARMTVLCVRGEIDASNHPELTAQAWCRDRGELVLALDLSEVAFLSVEGVLALRTIDERCAAANVQLLVIPSVHANRALRLAERLSRR